MPAAYTSKIDPSTGFINIFDFKKYSGSGINAKVKDKKEFLMSMNSIRYINEGSEEYEKSDIENCLRFLLIIITLKHIT